MKMLKRIILWTTLITVFVVGVLVSLGYFFRDEIVNYVLVELNKQIRSDIEVEEIDLSLLTSFPKASLNFKRVTGFEPNSKKDTLFDFDEVSLSFSVRDIYEENYVLQDIKIVNGKAALFTDKKGNTNYEIWFKEEEQGTDTVTNVAIDLSKVKLENVRVIWQDERREEVYDVHFKSTTAKGKFSEKQHATALYGRAKINQIKVGENDILPGENVKFDLGFEVDQESGMFQLSRGLFTLRNQFDFNVKGKFFANHFKLTYDAHKLEIESLKGLFPKTVRKELEDYKGKGVLELTGAVEKKKGKSIPRIDVEFSIRNGEVYYAKTKTSISNLSLNGVYSNGAKCAPKTSRLTLENVKGDFEKGHLNGELSIQNFDKPRLAIQVDAKYQLKDLLNFLPNDYIEKGEGEVELKATFNGKLSSLEKPLPKDLVKAKTSGRVKLKDVRLVLKKDRLDYHDINIDLSLKNDHVEIKEFSGKASNSDLQLEGTIRNLLPFIFYKEEQLTVKAKLKSEKVDLNQILSGNEDESKSEAYKLDLPSDIRLNLDVKVEELIFQEFLANKVRGELLLKKDKLDLNNVKFEACEGKWATSLSFYEKNENYFALKSSSSLKNVDITELFDVFGEFGQKAITHEHLKGKVNCDVQFGCIIGRDLKIESNSIKSVADLSILNGELIRYKPLYTIVDDVNDNKFLRLFVKLDHFREKLKHVKFSKLSNTLKIENEKITIPEMDIYSSAMAIHISGVHTFQNLLDYKIRFNLKEVLTKNEKVIKDTEYGYVKDDGAGNKMIFLRMKGDVDNIEVSLDKESRKQYNRKEVKKEVHKTKQILKEEFGLFKNDTTLTKEKTKEAEVDIDFGEFGSKEEGEKSKEKERKKAISTDTVKSKKKKNLWEKLRQKEERKKEEFQEFEFEDDDF